MTVQLQHFAIFIIPPEEFYFFNKNFLSVDYNCFTVLCWFLQYNEMNQPYVHIFPHPLDLPSPSPTIPPPRPSQGRELSSLGYTAASHEMSSLHTKMYIRQCRSLRSSSPFLPVSMSLFFTSASLFLPQKQVRLYHFSRLHTHALMSPSSPTPGHMP